MSTLQSIISDGFIRAFSLSIFHSLWQGALIAFLAGGISLFLARHRPVVRYVAYYALLLLMPVLFIITFIINYENTSSTITHTNPELISASSVQSWVEHAVPPFDTNTSTFVIFYHKLLASMESHAGWMVMLWFAGFLIFLVRFVGSLIYVGRLKSQQLIPVDAFWNDKLHDLARTIGLRRKIRFSESYLAKIPMTIGYIKPVILVPVGTLSGVPPQQVEVILLHELAHILRKDYLLNIIQSCVEWLMFYHPLTWWLSGLIRQEREHICDDIVISVKNDHLNYIKALTTMEEMNLKSPALASAIAGSRKKLLARVKRLIAPTTLRRGFSEGSIAFVLFLGLVFILSLNAFTYIPSTNDLKGKESGEHVYNILPFSPSSLNGSVPVMPTTPPAQNAAVLTVEPDTIISKSKSGKVIVHLYTDSTDVDDEQNLQVFVETIDDMVNDRKAIEREVIILKKQAEQLDSLRRIMVIKSDDSIKVIKDDTVIWLPLDYDTSFTTSGGFEFYGFEMPELPDLPEMKYSYHFKDDSTYRIEFEHNRKEFERHIREFENQQKDFERQMREVRVEIDAPDAHREYRRVPRHEMAPEPYMNKSEKIIRQELADDALTVRGKKYIIELDSKSMYINGEKQAKETYKKYRKLLESLEQMSLDGDDKYKLIF